jgi:hypothetical protein
MANKWYGTAVARLGLDTLDLAADDIRITAVTSSYTYDADHTTRANLGANEIASTATSALSINVTDTARVFKISANATLPDPGAGGPVDAYVIYEYVDGVAANDLLIAYIDTVTGVTLPLTLDGVDDTWNAGDVLRLGGSSLALGTNGNWYAEYLDKMVNSGVSGSLNGSSTLYAVGVTASHTPNVDDAGHASLADVSEAHECTPHEVLSSVVFEYVTARNTVELRAANFSGTFDNDASGTLQYIVIYIKGATFNPATPASNRSDTELVCILDLDSATVVMDSNPDNLTFDSAGISGRIAYISI